MRAVEGKTAVPPRVKAQHLLAPAAEEPIKLMRVKNYVELEPTKVATATKKRFVLKKMGVSTLFSKKQAPTK